MIDEELHTIEPYYGTYTVDDRNYDPNKPRIKDILWNNYDWLVEMEKQGKVRTCVLENIQRTLLCNTIYLGYDAFECPVCGEENYFYRKCHSRFCTSCGVKLQKQLAAKAEAMCVDIAHRHFVFTIPESYRNVFRTNHEALNFLFIAARNTVCKVVNENIYRKQKRKSARTGIIHNKKDNLYLYRNFSNQNIFGMIATLHTFGRDLKWNPHIHALVPELIFNPSTQKYKEFHHFNYQSLRKTWQYELNRLLLQYFGNKFRPYSNNSYISEDNGYYVYAKQSQNDSSDNSSNVSGCVNYMMRYAARPAMAESRITSYDHSSRMVEWYYDDHATEERLTVKESDLDLLKKMIIHIPDKHFRLVRYYGFYHSKKVHILDLIHQQLGQKRQIIKDKNERKKILAKKLSMLRFRTLCMDSFNRDMLKCSCGSIMYYIGSYNPLDGVHNDRKYRDDCFNEMRALRLHRAAPS